MFRLARRFATEELCVGVEEIKESVVSSVIVFLERSGLSIEMNLHFIEIGLTGIVSQVCQLVMRDKEVMDCNCKSKQ